MTAVPNLEFFEERGLDQPDVTVLLVRKDNGLLDLVRHSVEPTRVSSDNTLVLFSGISSINVKGEGAVSMPFTNTIPSALDIISDSFEEYEDDDNEEEENDEDENEDGVEDTEEEPTEESTEDDSLDDEVSEDEEPIFDAGDDELDALSEFDVACSVAATELSVQLLLEECNRDTRDAFVITVDNVVKSDIILEPTDEASDHHIIHMLFIDTDSLIGVDQSVIDLVSKVCIIAYRDDALSKLFSAMAKNNKKIDLLEYETYYQATIPYRLHEYSRYDEGTDDVKIVSDTRNMLYHCARNELKIGHRYTGRAMMNSSTVESIHGVVTSLALEDEVDGEDVILFLLGIAGLVHIDAVNLTTIEKAEDEQDLPAASWLFLAEYLEQHAGYPVGGIGKRAILETIDSYLTKYALGIED